MFRPVTCEEEFNAVWAKVGKEKETLEAELRRLQASMAQPYVEQVDRLLRGDAARKDVYLRRRLLWLRMRLTEGKVDLDRFDTVLRQQVMSPPNFN